MPRTREELAAETERFQEILDSGVRAQLTALPGVVHVTVGLKQVGGAATEEFSVKVYVEEKRPIGELAPEHLVPATVAGVPTDVCPVPTAENYTTVVGGMQITNGIADHDPAPPHAIGVEVGTLGFVALRNDKDQTPVMLSNAHVMGASGGNVGDPIFQPAPGPDPIDPGESLPRKPKTSENSVGTIVAIKAQSTIVDCAIAAVSTCYSCCCNCGTGYSHEIAGLQIKGSDAITGVALAVIGLDVFKVGITTGRTAGLVVATDAPLIISDFMGAPRTFVDQIEISGTVGGVRFANHGDSGSLIVDFNGKAVGLLTSGRPQAAGQDPSSAPTFANHIAQVMSELDIRLPATAEHPPAAVAAFRSEQVTALVDMPGFLDELTERLGRSAHGRRLRDVITRHGREAVELVNRRRRVTVAWHRGQGPAWLAAFARSARRPDYRLPDEIEGVTREEAVAALHAAFMTEAGDDFKADLREQQAFLLSALATCHTVEQLLERVEREPVPTSEQPT